MTRFGARVKKFVRDAPDVREAALFALAATRFRTVPKKGELAPMIAREKSLPLNARCSNIRIADYHKCTWVNVPTRRAAWIWSMPRSARRD